MLSRADAHNSSVDPTQTGRGRHADRRAGTVLRVTPDDFCGWLAMAMPGDTTVYHHGHLGRDRCRSTSALSEADRLRLTAIARQALLAAGSGRVHLVQRRHGEDNYSYVAIKTCPRDGVSSGLAAAALSGRSDLRRRSPGR